MVQVARFIKSQLSTSESEDLSIVDRLAKLLEDHLNDRKEDLAKAHVHGAPSQAIQEVVGELLEIELRFDQEVVMRAEDGLTVRPRPDFFYKLPNGRGILAEVERGGTTTNNHDLKDVWKAHISADTQHLFLIVPVNNWKPDGTPREFPYRAVIRRVGAFFGDPRREIDVTSAHIFGY